MIRKVIVIRIGIRTIVIRIGIRTMVIRIDDKSIPGTFTISGET